MHLPFPFPRLWLNFPGSVLASEGNLPDWLFELADDLKIRHDIALPFFSAEEVEQRRVRVASRLSDALRNWTETLGYVGVVNAASSLLTATGDRRTADHLRRRMWTTDRSPEDCSGFAYARYLHNYGETLLRAACLRNPHDREQDFFNWKVAADRDPTQFFARSVQAGGGPDSEARLLLCEFLKGIRVSLLDPQLSALLASLEDIFKIADTLPRAWIDACFSLAELLELQGRGAFAENMLENAHRSSISAGDEVRRAEAAWRLARNLAFKSGEDAAIRVRISELATECSEIARRLDIREADAGAALARTIDASTRRDFKAAAEAAILALEIYRSIGDLRGEFFAARELLLAHVAEAAQGGLIDTDLWDHLSLSLQQFAMENTPGLTALFKYDLAVLARYFDPQLAQLLANDAAEYALAQEHPLLITWAVSLRDALANQCPPRQR